MDKSEILFNAEIIKNEKRVFILSEIYNQNRLRWADIVDKIDSHFNIRVNPNTVSFHLRFLIEHGLIVKAGNLYTIRNSEKVSRILQSLK